MSALSDAVAAMNMSHDLEPGTIIADAFVIARLIDPLTAAESFMVSGNKSMTPIIKIGLITAAHTVVIDGDWDVQGGDS